MSPDGDPLLAVLATIWAERWVALGGTLIADVDGDRCHCSIPLNWRDKRRPHLSQQLWHEAWHVGRWRELVEIAKLVPGLERAVAQLVRRNEASV